MKKQTNILEIIVQSILGGCMIGLVVGFTYLYFIPAFDFIFSLIGERTAQYVFDQFEPFRVALYSGFVGSFLTVFLFELNERRNQK